MTSILREEDESLLDRLPDDSTIEDVHYWLYDTHIVRNGLESVERNGGLT